MKRTQTLTVELPRDDFSGFNAHDVGEQPMIADWRVKIVAVGPIQQELEESDLRRGVFFFPRGVQTPDKEAIHGAAVGPHFVYIDPIDGGLNDIPLTDALRRFREGTWQYVGPAT